jgi:carbon storage regulator
MVCAWYGLAGGVCRDSLVAVATFSGADFACSEQSTCPTIERNRMLVLSRRVNEELIIDGSIRVVVLSVQGNRVRLGVSAPEDMSIRRGEIEVTLSAHGSPEYERAGASLATV